MNKFSLYGKIIVGIGIFFIALMGVGLAGISNQASFIEENLPRLALSFIFAFVMIGFGAYLVKRKSNTELKENSMSN